MATVTRSHQRRRVTKQEQFDQQAMDQLLKRLPATAKVVGSSEIWLGAPDGVSMDRLGVASIRVSKGRENMLSPEIQWDSIKDAAKRKKIHITKIFIDMHRTGRRFEKRAVIKIAQEIKADQYKHVLLWKWSRWGRNEHLSQVYLYHTEENGGQVHSATEDIDATTAVGKFTRGQMLLLAELESNLKSEDWKTVHEYRREAGLPHGGGPRFGYLYVDGKYLVDPIIGPILRQCYLDYTAGLTGGRLLANRLNRMDLFTTRGNPWQASKVLQMLDNGFAAGWIREQSSPKSEQYPRKKMYDKWRRGAHEALITEEEWAAFKEKRAAVPVYENRRGPSGMYELTGLVVHFSCESAMHHNFHPDDKSAWRCALHSTAGDAFCEGTSANARELMAEVLRWIDVQGTEPALAARMARQQNDGEAQALIATLEARKGTLAATMGRLKLQFKDGDLEYGEYRADMDAVKAELNTVVLELAAARRAHSDWSRERFLALSDAWDYMEIEERQEALQAIIRYVIVWSPGRSPRGAPLRPPLRQRVRVVGMWEDDLPVALVPAP